MKVNFLEDYSMARENLQLQMVFMLVISNKATKMDTDSFDGKMDHHIEGNTILGIDRDKENILISEIRVYRRVNGKMECSMELVSIQIRMVLSINAFGITGRSRD